MTSKINISCILKDHFQTLKNERTKSFDALDISVFFGLPIAIGSVSFFLKAQMDDNSVTTLISAASIFSGLLINVLVLIYSLNEKSIQNPEGNDHSENDNHDVNKKTLEKELLKEIFANISFSILISMMLIISLSFLVFLKPGYLAIIFTSISIALCTNFCLTLLMGLKRIHILLSDKFG